MNTKPDSCWLGKRFQDTIYTLSEKKSNDFSAFLSIFSFLKREKEKGRVCVPLRWGRLRRLGSLAHARRQFSTAEARTATGYYYRERQ